MKNKNILFYTVAFLLAGVTAQAQIGIGTQTPDASAALDITSTNKGLLIPRVADPATVASPATGLQVYSTTTNTVWVYNGTTWVNSAQDLRVQGTRNHYTSDAGLSATSGSDNIGIGNNTLTVNASNNNIAVGADALGVSTGSGNVAVGRYALSANTTGIQNTAIGTNAGNSITTGNRNIAIGQGAQVADPTAVGQLSIANAIFGTGVTGSVTAPAGNIGIGTAAPINAFHVARDKEDYSDTAQLVVSGAANPNQRVVMGYNTTANKGFIQSVQSGTAWTDLLLNPTNGNVGVGTTAPGSKFEVNGASTNTSAFNAGAGTAINYSRSNLAYTTASAGAFTLQNIKDGGTYTLSVRGAASGTATFTASGFTVKYANNRATTANTETLYTFIVMGTTVYVYTATGF